MSKTIDSGKVAEAAAITSSITLPAGVLRRGALAGSALSMQYAGTVQEAGWVSVVIRPNAIVLGADYSGAEYGETMGFRFIGQGKTPNHGDREGAWWIDVHDLRLALRRYLHVTGNGVLQKENLLLSSEYPVTLTLRREGLRIECTLTLPAELRAAPRPIRARHGMDSLGLHFLRENATECGIRGNPVSVLEHAIARSAGAGTDLFAGLHNGVSNEIPAAGMLWYQTPAAAEIARETAHALTNACRDSGSSTATTVHSYFATTGQFAEAPMHVCPTHYTIVPEAGPNRQTTLLRYTAREAR